MPAAQQLTGRRGFLVAVTAATIAPRAMARSGPASHPALAGASVRQVWLGTADRRHGHDALGAGAYPGTLHARVEIGGRVHSVRLELPAEGAFEDGLVRTADLDGDGSAEVVVVSATREDGAALTVYGIDASSPAPVLVERARSPSVGRMRWLNPVGVGDFDGDGCLELVSVSTPHIGGVLTLYRYAPPRLVPVAWERDVSNHQLGDPEQGLAAVIMRGGRPTVAVPDQSRRRLRYLVVNGAGQWESAAADTVFEAPIQRVAVLDDGGLQVRAGARTVVVR